MTSISQLITENFTVILILVLCVGVALGFFFRESRDEEEPTPEQLEEVCKKYCKEWETLPQKDKAFARGMLLNAYFSWVSVLDKREGPDHVY